MKFKLPRRRRRYGMMSSLLIDLMLALGVVGSIWAFNYFTSETAHPPSTPSLSGKATDRSSNVIQSRSAQRMPSPSRPAEMEDVLSMALNGRYEEAVKSAHNVTADLRSAALASVFAMWADKHPQQAADAALALPETAERSIAWNAVITNWGQSAPDQLAASSLAITDPIAQQQALAIAIPRWLERNENEALQWVSALPPSVNGDMIIAQVARYEPLIIRDPNLALTWAEAIHEPSLRSRTLGDVVRAWLPSAPEEAAHYARESPDISPSEREDILVGERFTEHP